MRSLSETFNVNYFLVSQTNPHIVPLMNLKKRVPRKLGNFVETEWKHRWGLEQERLVCPWRAAFISFPHSRQQLRFREGPDGCTC